MERVVDLLEERHAAAGRGGGLLVLSILSFLLGTLEEGRRIWNAVLA